MTSPTPRTFWALGTGYNGGAVIQKLPDGSPPAFSFFEAKPLAAAFPANGTMCFSPDYKKELKVLDSVASDLGMPIVSARVKDIFERLAPQQCEFLPVVLLNHKNKVASREHAILNPLRVVDFIDMTTSKFRLSTITPDQISTLKELHIRADQVEPTVRVFRAKTRRRQIFIDDAIHAAFQQAQLTGLRLFPAEGWDGDTM